MKIWLIFFRSLFRSLSGFMILKQQTSNYFCPEFSDNLRTAKKQAFQAWLLLTGSFLLVKAVELMTWAS